MPNTIVDTTASLEASLASAGAKIATGGGLVSAIAFVSSAQFVAIVGIVTAILGSLITWYFKRRDSMIIQKESEERTQREKQETETRIANEKERLEMDKQKHAVEMLKLTQGIMPQTPVIETVPK